MSNKMNEYININSGKRIMIATYVYWLILVIVQNMGEYMATSSAALVLKLALIILLTYVFVRKAKIKSSPRFLIWSAFVIYILLMFITKKTEFKTKELIYYIFPAIFSFLVYVCQTDATMSKELYFKFFKLITATVAYMALYCVFFRTDYFRNFLSLNVAYGNELSSFFLSGHEYGMYLIFGIISAYMCSKNTSKKKYVTLYRLLILLFVVNLVLTLSRTSYTSFILIVCVFTFTSDNKNLKSRFALLLFAAALFFVFSSDAREFVPKILFKESNDAGRFDMWNSAIMLFKRGSLYEQIFGYGYSYINKYLDMNFQHSTFHNMFLQTLLIWGVFGLLYLFAIIFASIKNALSIRKIDKNLSALFLAMSLSTITFMMTNTACLMQSPIDSYMMTLFLVIMPKYVVNAVRSGKYIAVEETINE